MRVLLYTATLFFVGLTGLFAFYALQPPSSSDGGPKVVLSIDASTMPQPDVVENQSAPLTPYGSEEAQVGNAAEFTPGAEPSERVADQTVLAAHSEATAPSTAMAASAKPEAIPLSGTMLSVETPHEGRDVSAENIAPLATGKPQAAANQRLATAPTATPAPSQTPAAAPAPAAGQRVASAQAPSPDPAVRKPGKPGDTLASNLAALDAPYGAPEPGATPAAANATPSTSPVAAAVPPAAPAVPAAPPLPSRRPAQMPPLVKTAAVDGSTTLATMPVTTVENAPKQVRIAILIRGIGNDSHDAKAAINNLPAAVSLGFVPNSSDAKEWATKARDAGHEVIVQLPLEPFDPASPPSAEALTSSAEPVQNVALLNTMLERFDGPSGVTNIMGGKLLQSKEALRPILQSIKSRGLIYIAEGNNSHVLVRQMAHELNLRYGSANVIIDTQPTPDAVKKSLERLVSVAQKKGSAIGIGSASGVTIEQLQTWAQSLAPQGIILVPVGALAQTPGAS